MKKDKYSRQRGGKSRMLNIHCATCNTHIVRYQKDGPGNLLRCYLNRIFAPPELEQLQDDPTIKEPSDMPNLACTGCNTVIGTPMRHIDDRLAFRLRKGTYAFRAEKGGRP